MEVKRPIVITTIATRNYLPRTAEWCLPFLQRHAAPAQTYIGGAGCNPAHHLDLRNVGSYIIPRGMLDKSLANPGTGCIQHGNWLPYCPAPDDATIICIDGDVKMQRPFNADELQMLYSWDDGVVGIGPNEPRPGGDDMQNELTRINPLLSHEEVWKRFYPHATTPPPLGNAGVLVATKSTWLALWARCLGRWLDVGPVFSHIAVGQWLINLVINESFERYELPQTFHTHGHWGYPGTPFAGWGFENTATVDGETILFAHKTW